MTFLEVKDLYLSYGKQEVLKNINFTLEEGELLVLLGPSGSGKSSLLHAIAGLEPIRSGEIVVNGRDIGKVLPPERDIAMLFQNLALYPTMTVAQNLSFALEMRHVNKQQRADAVERVAGLLKIRHLLSKRPSELSGGQQQRVAIGRALVRDPQLFLLDEPLAHLDAKLRVEIRTEIKRLHQRIARTMIYVTHDQLEAMNLATQLAVIKDGVLQQIGSPQEVYNNPINLFVADFLGSPPMNVLKGRVILLEGRVHLLIERSGLEPLLLPVLKRAAGILETYNGREVIMGIRPEALTSSAHIDPSAANIAHADCLVEVIEAAGADSYAICRLSGREVFCRIPAELRVQSGQILSVAFHLDKALYFDPDSEARLA